MDFAIETVETTGRRVEIQQQRAESTLKTPSEFDFCGIQPEFTAKIVSDFKVGKLYCLGNPNMRTLGNSPGEAPRIRTQIIRVETTRSLEVCQN